MINQEIVMSFEKFEDECPGCRPAIIDQQTGKLLSDDSPTMVIVLGVWANTTRQEREAFHRCTCLNSRTLTDLQMMNDLVTRIQEALKSGSQ